MEHTTFENELRDIRRRAINELEEAVKAHTGSYFWDKKDRIKVKSGAVITGINTRDKEHGETYGFVCTLFTVQIHDLGEVFLDENVFVEEMPIEDILAITEAIPETDEVNDVSGVYPVPVTWVDRDDIEMQGFNTDGMTQKDLEKLAERMCDIYNNGDFCSDLDLSCKDCGLKEKED